MGKREIAGLASKILGIYLIVQGINVMANVLPLSLATPNQEQPAGVFKLIFPYIFLIGFGVLLWFFADKLSVRMVKEESSADKRFALSADDIQRIVFSGLGLLFIGNSFPKLVTALINIYTMRDLPETMARLLPGVAGSLAQIVLGAAVFLGSQGLVNFLNGVRYVGIKRKENSFEEDDDED